MKHSSFVIAVLLGGGAVCLAQVMSVGIAVPPWLQVSNSPITGSGVMMISPNTGQTSGRVIGTCGSATTFTPCALVGGDLPTATASSQGAVTVPASVVVLGSNGSSILGAASTTGTGSVVVLQGDPTLVSAIVAPAATSGTPSGTAGNAFQVGAATFTDNATAGGGTAPAYAASTVSQPTLASSAASTVTTTTASTVSINGAVLAGTKELITNSLALNIAPGSTPGGVTVYSTGTTPPTANLTNSGLMMDCTVVSTGAPGAAVNTYSECNVPFPAWDFVAQRNIVAQPKSVATNASKTIGVSITYGANTPGNAVQLQALIVEVVR